MPAAAKTMHNINTIPMIQRQRPLNLLVGSGFSESGFCLLSSMRHDVLDVQPSAHP